MLDCFQVTLVLINLLGSVKNDNLKDKQALFQREKRHLKVRAGELAVDAKRLVFLFKVTVCLWVNKPWDWAFPPRCLRAHAYSPAHTLSSQAFVLQPFVKLALDSAKLYAVESETKEVSLSFSPASPPQTFSLALFVIIFFSLFTWL